jgi:urea-proton symporter
MYAGLFASVVTDTVKGVVIVIIAIVVVSWAIIDAGGLPVIITGVHGIKASATDNPLEEFFTGNGLTVMLTFGIPGSLGWIAGQFGDPYYWQQANALKQDPVKRTFVLAAFIFAFIPLSLSMLGFLGSGMGLKVQNSQYINLEVIGALLPWGAGMLFIGLLTFALISTLDSHLAAISALAGHDIFNSYVAKRDGRLSQAELDRGSVRYSLASIPILAACGIVIALVTSEVLKQQPGTTIIWLLLCYGTLRAATFLPTVFTLLRLDVSERGMFWGILASLSGGFLPFVYGNLYNVTWAKIAGSLIAILASGCIALLSLKFSRSYARV